MPLRGPDNREYDGSQDEWEQDDNPLEGLSDESEVDAGTGEGVEVSEEPEASDDYITGKRDPEMGMKPVIVEVPREKTPGPPPERGRHVGTKALSLLSRLPLVGLKWLRSSSEFVIYDNQPPPSGEYAVQALGVTALEYDGVVQNHLLVSFKAGQLTGFGMEDNYSGQEIALGVVSDYAIDVMNLLSNRAGRTIVIQHNRNMSIKFNSTSSIAIQIYAVQSPYIVDLGLNISALYLTTTQATTVRFQVW
jgi:hypothetical protein